jgi:sugar phosphate isomerase/epimerase
VRLVLSTAAATGFTVDELLAACRRRGLAGIELVAGHAHGVGAGLDATALGAIRRRLESGGAPVAAFRTTLAEAFHPNAARLSSALGAPVVADREGEDGIEIRADALLAAATAYAAVGGTLLVVHGSEPDEVGRLRRVIERAPAGVLGLAWEVDPAAGTITGRVAAVLEAAGPHLRYVRLLGGGPESAQHEGRGIGPLMAHLALAGYGGPLALAPSTPRYRTAWSRWLGRGGGWGCGSKAADPSLVRLERS